MSFLANWYAPFLTWFTASTNIPDAPANVTEYMKLFNNLAVVVRKLKIQFALLQKHFMKYDYDDDYYVPYAIDNFEQNVLGDMFGFYFKHIDKIRKDPYAESELIQYDDILYRESQYYTTLTPEEVRNLLGATAIDCALSQLYLAAYDRKQRNIVDLECTCEILKKVLLKLEIVLGLAKSAYAINYLSDDNGYSDDSDEY
jgi:hypothetical protein